MELHSLTLRHFSARPVDRAVHSVTQIDSQHFKPRGFWVSVQDFGAAWNDWCIGEGWNLGGLAHEHAVTLATDADVLLLSGPEMIRAFHSEYHDESAERYLRNINWSRVAARYQGIIIAPYQWSMRLDDVVGWYYSWDCASGCIWDANAIASIVPVCERTQVAT